MIFSVLRIVSIFFVQHFVLVFHEVNEIAHRVQRLTVF